MVVGLRDNCEYEGFEVVVATDGEEGLRKAVADSPDLILLDVMLPRLSGLDVCRSVRRRGLTVPIIMLTARGQEMDKVVGLEIGADDYVTKPFGVRELMARMRVQLRRVREPFDDPASYQFGDVALNFERHEAAKGGRPLALSPREFAILRYMVRRRGDVITREQLLDEVWGIHDYPLTRTVDNHIAKLRQKVEPVPAEPEYIITLHRVGYKFLG
jgi:two-component system alkaline phosphatase synthesis response regulator PhoP